MQASRSARARRAWRRCRDRFPVPVRLRPSTRRSRHGPRYPSPECGGRTFGCHAAPPSGLRRVLPPSRPSGSSHTVPAPNDPGVVADEMNGIEALERLVRECLDRVRVGHVAHDAMRTVVADRRDPRVRDALGRRRPSRPSCLPREAPARYRDRSRLPLRSRRPLDRSTPAWRQFASPSGPVRSAPRTTSAVDSRTDDGSDHACCAGLEGRPQVVEVDEPPGDGEVDQHARRRDLRV